MHSQLPPPPQKATGLASGAMLLIMVLLVAPLSPVAAESWAEKARRLGREAAEKLVEVAPSTASIEAMAGDASGWMPRVAIVRDVKCLDDGFQCVGRVQVGPDVCGDACQFEVQIDVVLVVADFDTALQLRLRVDDRTFEKVISLRDGADAVGGKFKFYKSEAGQKYAAMNHFKSCFPVALPPLGIVGVCNTFERTINEPAGISNDYILSFEFGQFSPVVFTKRLALDYESLEENDLTSTSTSNAAPGGQWIHCGKMTEPDACLLHSQCGWCTQSQLCLPDGGSERAYDMLGTCPRCSYFRGYDDGASVGVAEQCTYRPGCGLCRDARKGKGAGLIQSFNCIAGDNVGPTGTFEPCFAWSPSNVQDEDDVNEPLQKLEL